MIASASTALIAVTPAVLLLDWALRRGGACPQPLAMFQ